MKNISIIIIFLLCSSCYKTLELDGFDTSEWRSKEPCSAYRINSVNLVMENRELILEATQNEVESLLGAADEHELYERNQKFFHYRLTPADTCLTGTAATKYLSIRFNAIGRASDMQVVIRD
ncbi:MAG: hypothetical protein RIM99_15540 [Cyclobacteriaceae bacterium]